MSVLRLHRAVDVLPCDGRALRERKPPRRVRSTVLARHMARPLGPCANPANPSPSSRSLPSIPLRSATRSPPEPEMSRRAATPSHHPHGSTPPSPCAPKRSASRSACLRSTPAAHSKLPLAATPYPNKHPHTSETRPTIAESRLP